MTVFLNFDSDSIVVTALAESLEDDVLGDMWETVRPGGQFLGYSYDELRALGEGKHDLEPK